MSSNALDNEKALSSLKYTCHLNLKEGISNMKACYIPDFGYADQLNFSIDSAARSRASLPQNEKKSNHNWKALANQILLPFAPKYSLMLRTLQESERRAREKIKVAEIRRHLKRVGTKVNIRPLSLPGCPNEREKQLKEFQDMIIQSPAHFTPKQKKVTLKCV